MDLHLDNIVLEYPDGDSVLTAVDHASLSVAAGSTMALLGPSGSGKSSLLAVAAGLTRPTSGVVRIGDEVVFAPETSVAEAAAVRLERIGIVFQQPQLLESLTAIEQIELRAHVRGGSRKNIQVEALELLDAVGLADRAHHRPGKLSGGQRQRVAIARAIWGRPDILLVDEPTSALDHERGLQVIDLITGLAREIGAAAIIVSHDQSTLTAVDSIAQTVDGRVQL